MCAVPGTVLEFHVRWFAQTDSGVGVCRQLSGAEQVAHPRPWDGPSRRAVHPNKAAPGLHERFSWMLSAPCMGMRTVVSQRPPHMGVRLRSPRALTTLRQI